MTALTKAERDALWAAPNSDVAKLLATCNALEAEIASLREAQDDQRRVLGNRIAELERERSDEWDAKHAAMRDRIEQLKDERDLLAAWIEWAREACSSRGSDTSPARAIFATDDEVRAWMEQRKGAR